MRHVGKATLVTHSAVFGVHRTEVREIVTTVMEPYAQYARAVSVTFRYPRKRTWKGCTVVPENIYFVTVEADGRVIYDSRTEVPCDMAKWEAAYKRLRQDQEAIRRELEGTIDGACPSREPKGQSDVWDAERPALAAGDQVARLREEGQG